MNFFYKESKPKIYFWGMGGNGGRGSVAMVSDFLQRIQM